VIKLTVRPLVPNVQALPTYSWINNEWSYSMEVVVLVFWHIKVDHNFDSFHIYSSCKDVGINHYSVFELLKVLVSCYSTRENILRWHFILPILLRNLWMYWNGGKGLFIKNSLEDLAYRDTSDKDYDLIEL
jgi:hypothetical protein